MCEKWMSCECTVRGISVNSKNRFSSWPTTPFMVTMLCILKALTAGGKTTGEKKSKEGKN
jgi:hypothetical protein